MSHTPTVGRLIIRGDIEVICGTDNTAYIIVDQAMPEEKASPLREHSTISLHYNEVVLVVDEQHERHRASQ